MTEALRVFSSPQLHKVHSGKVRESFTIDSDRRMIVATDRVSAFDKVYKNTLPGKGAILTGISNAWFLKTQDIIPNHFLEAINPNISIVRHAEPLRVEVIVRKYLTGSAWRAYAKGERTVCGVPLPDGMTKNQPFPQPIITPTTKEASDRPITRDDVIAGGLVPQKIWEQIEEVAVALFNFGTELCASKGLILVDTKYEFGLINGKLALIDEVHTPDSSRFWLTGAYDRDPASEHWMDKEYIRQWLLASTENPTDLDELPEQLVQEAMQRYRQVYEWLVGETPPPVEGAQQRMVADLVKGGWIKDGYVAVVCASKRDLDHALEIKKHLDGYGVMVDIRCVSAHKNGEDAVALCQEYNEAIEPGAVIAIAGRSNGLGGALSANLAVPVINCPPYGDKVDMAVNVQSSLQMPSNAPAATCVTADNAAQCALRCLNLPRLKGLFIDEVAQVKADLRELDRQFLETYRHASTHKKWGILR